MQKNSGYSNRTHTVYTLVSIVEVFFCMKPEKKMAIEKFERNVLREFAYVELNEPSNLMAAALYEL